MCEEKKCEDCKFTYCTKQYRGGCDGKQWIPLSVEKKVIIIRHHVIKELVNTDESNIEKRK